MSQFLRAIDFEKKKFNYPFFNILLQYNTLPKAYHKSGVIRTIYSWSLDFADVQGMGLRTQ
jgi:hypothetical protein